MDFPNETQQPLEMTTSTPFYPSILVIGHEGDSKFYELGALMQLQKHGYLNNIKTVVGVSYGACVALLIVCGFKLENIVQMLVKSRLFKSGSMNYFPQVATYHHEKRQFLWDVVTRKFGFVPNLDKLKLLTNKDFVTVAYNLTRQQVEYFKAENEPTMSCVDAVLLSWAEPAFAVEHGFSYKDNQFIDGSIGNPYPANAFDNGSTPILCLSTRSRLSNVDQGVLQYVSALIDVPVLELKKAILERLSSQCRHFFLDMECAQQEAQQLMTKTNLDDQQEHCELAMAQVAHGYMLAKTLVENFSIQIPIEHEPKLVLKWTDSRSTITYDFTSTWS